MRIPMGRVRKNGACRDEEEKDGADAIVLTLFRFSDMMKPEQRAGGKKTEKEGCLALRTDKGIHN